MFLFTGCLYEELIELTDKDLCRFISKEDSHHEDVEAYTGNNVTDNYDVDNESDSFFMEIKEHLIQCGDPFLVTAFENYLPFKQESEDIVQEGKDKCTNGVKDKERQLFAR
jgi:hypothetical protein